MRVLFVIFCLFFCVSAAGAQTLKSGDTLTITVLQDPKLDRTVVVDPAGEIAFPLAGHVRARGLTAQAVENISSPRFSSLVRSSDRDPMWFGSRPR